MSTKIVKVSKMELTLGAIVVSTKKTFHLLSESQ